MVKMSKSISKSYMNNQNFLDEDEDTDEMDSCPDQSAQDTTSPDDEPNTSQSKKDRTARILEGLLGLMMTRFTSFKK